MPQCFTTRHGPRCDQQTQVTMTSLTQLPKCEANHPERIGNGHLQLSLQINTATKIKTDGRSALLRLFAEGKLNRLLRSPPSPTLGQSSTSGKEVKGRLSAGLLCLLLISHCTAAVPVSDVGFIIDMTGSKEKPRNLSQYTCRGTSGPS